MNITYYIVIAVIIYAISTWSCTKFLGIEDYTKVSMVEGATIALISLVIAIAWPYTLTMLAFIVPFFYFSFRD